MAFCKEFISYHVCAIFSVMEEMHLKEIGKEISITENGVFTKRVLKTNNMIPKIKEIYENCLIVFKWLDYNMHINRQNS